MSDLYDVESALRELARQRRRQDSGIRAVITLAERLADNLGHHFGPEAIETAGLALVIGAASVGALALENIPPAALTNVLAFAGQRLVLDGRAAEEADRV